MAQPVETIAQLFYQAVERNLPDALAAKRNGVYEPISHAEVVARVERLALAMHTRGLRPGDRVAIMSEIRPVWFIADFACVKLMRLVTSLRRIDVQMPFLITLIESIR